MRRLALSVTLLFLALFLVFPLFSLLRQAFWVEEGGGHLSLAYFGLLWDNPYLRDCFLNSLWIACCTTFLCLALAVPLGHAFTSFDFPLKGFLQAALLLPFVLPPFVGAIGIKQFFARFGSLNLLLAQIGVVDLSRPPDWLGEGGLWGIVFLETLHFLPVLFLSVQAAFANMDPSLKEASRNMGAGPWKIKRGEGVT